MLQSGSLFHERLSPKWLTFILAFTINEICDKIKAKMAPDENFKQAFTNWEGSITTTTTIQYILRKINKSLSRNEELNEDKMKLNVEHIMPVKLSKAWSISKEDHNKYLWRLGNLTLLGTSLNKSGSNLSFKDKLPKLKASKVELNKYFLTCTDWNPKEIEKRQLNLSNQAANIWK